MRFICSSCNAEIIPKNRFSVLIECSYCHTGYRKVGGAFLDNGKVAALPPDMSFIQIGTTGVFEGKSFTIIGRIKVAWEHGTWNEWFAEFEDDTNGWLADFIGRFCFTFPFDPEVAVDFSSLVMGQKIQIAHEPMMVVDIKKITYIGFEGEIPFERKIGETGISIDLQSSGKNCAFLDNFDHRVNLYEGKVVDSNELALENIRLLDGW